jgi:3-hydroxy-9,10-secoandrosta-1,3,5(10)-triene-9,17-dione monooxygenase reductase component
MPDEDARRFRDTMGAFPTGVAVVSASGPGGPAGLTTNAVTSLSLDPLLLLVCFDNGSRTLNVVRETRRFAVSVLSAGQEEVASVFASKRVAAEKFAAAAHLVQDGLPVIDGAAAWVACDLVELMPGGDHTIGVGAVTGMEADPAAEPLVFWRGAYARVARQS